MGYGEVMELKQQQMMDCPGCGVLTSRALVACGPCWKRVPGDLKGRLTVTEPNTFGRARVVGSMRLWLKANPRTP